MNGLEECIGEGTCDAGAGDTNIMLDAEIKLLAKLTEGTPASS